MTAQKAFGVFVFLTIASFLVPIPSAGAHVFEPSPPDTPYTLEILVDGSPLQRHAARGKTYIEALPGKEYSIRLRNNTDRRVAVALSVDGLNTIDAKTTTARSASKWILDPWQEITLDGWQTSASTARRFFFTSEEASYGAWLGKTSNLGVITAVVFREKRMRPVPIDEGKRKDQDEPRSEPSMQGSAGAPSAVPLKKEA